MKFLLSLISLASTLILNAQVEYSIKKHDFGEMDAYANRVIDVKMTNRGSSDVFILRVATERQVRYLYSNQKIPSGGTETLRLKVNPQGTGKWKADVLVYTSDSQAPHTITLKGNIKEMPVDGSPECPDFSGSVSMEQQMEFDFKVKVIDKLSGAPIHSADVMIVKNGRPAFEWETNRKGMVEKRFPLGYYYFVFRANGYDGKEFAAFVNRRNHTLIVELMPLEDEPEVILSETFELDQETEEEAEDLEVVNSETAESVEAEKEEIVIELELEEVKEEEAAVEVAENEEVEEVPEDVVRSPSSAYTANNIVFVLDISWSMSQDGKLDLLKASMLELVANLRYEDRLTLVSFAGSAQVISEPMSMTESNKDLVSDKITALTADGNTNGGKGIRTAYRLARENYIKGGNNTIILATDGAFNQYDAGFTSTIKSQAKKGINMSVAGVKAGESAEKSMIAISEMGKGDYVKIVNYESALDALVNQLLNK